MTKAFHNNVKLSGYSRKVNPVYHVETKKENRWTLQKKKMVLTAPMEPKQEKKWLR